MSDARHVTHVEFSAKGCFYAWCSNQDCYWQSPYRKAEDAVLAFAFKHEASTRKSQRRPKT